MVLRYYTKGQNTWLSLNNQHKFDKSLESSIYKEIKVPIKDDVEEFWMYMYNRYFMGVVIKPHKVSIILG